MHVSEDRNFKGEVEEITHIWFKCMCLGMETFKEKLKDWMLDIELLKQ